MKNNIKRAFKTISKLNDRYSNIFYFDLNNGNKVITDGKIIVTVDNRQFEENKQFLINLQYRDLNQLLTKEFDFEMDTVRLTSVVFNTSDNLLMRVIKAGKKRLGAINEIYHDVLIDCGCTPDYMITRKTEEEKIKSPLLYGVFDGDKNLCNLYGLCPVNFNVREALEGVLN